MASVAAAPEQSHKIDLEKQEPSLEKQVTTESQSSQKAEKPRRAHKVSGHGVHMPHFSIKEIVAATSAQVKIKDEADVFPVLTIFLAMLIAVCCGFAAFVLHLAVAKAGCLGGVNGCHDQILLDVLEPFGISRSVFFIVLSGLSGLLCSAILYSKRFGNVPRQCKGGGSGHTKIVVASGAHVSGWVVILRILLASIYMGGGNPLGTEGPIIHLSVSLATWMVAQVGKRHRRKFLGTFAVIGAAAGISAGFNVLVTGFVYVIEELTRTLSKKLSLILALAAAVAVLFKDYVEYFLDTTDTIHVSHAYLFPKYDTWKKLTDDDIQLSLLLSVPIGVLMGVAGWLFTETAFRLLLVFNRDERVKRIFPPVTHLALIGIVCGCLGALGYEVTGVNGVWGTTVGAITEVLDSWLPWEQVLLLFFLKFVAFILATAGGGPGGLLVPSLITGGLLGTCIGRLIDGSVPFVSACAVIGMGGMFASVMHMPLTGIIIIFELTRANQLMLQVVIANFVATNIVCRLPRGEHSFVHRSLELDPVWHKLQHRDFIETDDQENNVTLALYDHISTWLLTDQDRIRIAFDAWHLALEMTKWEKEAAQYVCSTPSTGSSSNRKVRTIHHMGDIKMPETLSSGFRSWGRSFSMVDGRGAKRAKRAKTVELKVMPSEPSDGSDSMDLTGTSSTPSYNVPPSEERKIKTGHWRGTNSCPHQADLGKLLPSLPSELPDPSSVVASTSTSKTSDQTPRMKSSGTIGEIADAEERARRQITKEQWDAVSAVIPNLNVRVWKALDQQQREALAGMAVNLQKSGGLSASGKIDYASPDAKQTLQSLTLATPKNRQARGMAKADIPSATEDLAAEDTEAPTEACNPSTVVAPLRNPAFSKWLVETSDDEDVQCHDSISF